MIHAMYRKILGKNWKAHEFRALEALLAEPSEDTPELAECAAAAQEIKHIYIYAYVAEADG